MTTLVFPSQARHRPEIRRRTIIVEWVHPPIPGGGWFEAYDDSLGADDSPYGRGGSFDEAVRDLLDMLEGGPDAA